MGDQKLNIDIIVNDQQALAKLRTALKQVETDSAKTSKSFTENWLKVTAVYAGVAIAIGKVVKAAMEQEDAINRVNQSLRLQGTFTEKLSQQYVDLSERIEQSSKFADEAILNSIDTLISFGNVGTKSMDRVIQATVDLASKTGSLESASMLMAKASAGNTSALSRFGIVVDQTGNKAEKFEKVLSFIEDRFGGSAQNELNTFAGQIALLRNNWDNLLESLGMFITRSDTAHESIKKLNDLIKGMTKGLDEAKDVLKSDDFSMGVARTMLKWFPLITEAYFKMNREQIQEYLTGWSFRLQKEKEFADTVASLQNQTVTSRTGQVVNARLAGDETAPPEAPSEEAIASVDIAKTFLDAEINKINQARFLWGMWNNEKTQMAMAQIQAETEFLTLALDAQRKAHQSLWVAVGQIRDVFQAGMSKMFMDMIKGTLNFKEAIKELGLNMVQILIDFALQKAINFALSKAMAGAEIAIATATGTAIAAAYAPAAAMASLMSFGGNAAPAAAALTTTTALAQLLAIPKFAEGGIVDKPTIALIGEAGREAVVPLDRGRRGGVGDININFEINGNIFGNEKGVEDFVEAVAPRISQFLDRERERL